MNLRKSALKLLAYLIPSGGIIYIFYQEYVHNISTYIFLFFFFSIIVFVEDFVSPYLKGRSNKKNLKFLIRKGFKVKKDHYLGKWKGYDTKVSYFRQPQTNLPSIHLTLETGNFSKHSLSNSHPEYFIENSAINQVYEISDMREIEHELEEKLDYLVANVNRLK